MSQFAPLPDPPYYAVIFASQQSADTAGYARMAEKMAQLAETMPGYIGTESTRDPSGFGITVSYWSDEDSLRAWQENTDHIGAQTLGKTRWYEDYVLRISKVERAYSGPSGR